MNFLNTEENNKNLRKPFFVISFTVVVASLSAFFISSTNDLESDLGYFDSFRQNYKIFALNIPQQMEFATEPVPISRFDVKESFDQELLVNTYWQSNTLLNIKRANRWFPIIEPILAKNNVPDDFKYLALIESGFKNVVSPAGAAGYWQFLKTSAKEYGLEVNDEIDERYHVEKATEAACKYLTDAKQRLGSWTLAAAAYNAGVAGVKRQMVRQNSSSYYDLLLNDETARYVFRILAAKEILSNPTKYGFQFRKTDLYKDIETYEITVDTTIADLAAFAHNNNINYKLLKIFNPWLRDSSLPNKSRKTYTIKLPKEPFSGFSTYSQGSLPTDSI